MENKKHFYHSLEFDAKIKIIIYKSYEKNAVLYSIEISIRPRKKND